MRLGGSIAVGVAAFLVAACAAIGGLGDYEEVECVGGCADAAIPETSGDEGEAAPAVVEFATIGGNASGLKGAGLILKNNGADAVQISKDGPFLFPAKVRNGDPYAVTVSAQPSNPAQECAVERGAGTVKGANVTDVGVTCTNVAYTVGGTVVGLGVTAKGLVLTNNGADPLPIAANGKFTFPAKVPTGAAFAIGVKTQPTGGGPCRVSGGTGSVGLGNVTSPVVNCEPGKFTVGGMVTGLNGTVVLKNNGGSDLSLNSNGSFAFSTTVVDLAPYVVTVATPPSYPPRSQTCTVTGGMGSVAGADVTSVSVACATNSFTVGGMITGLTGTLVLLQNGGDPRTTNTTGPFTFATPVISGTPYSVTVSTPSLNQSCIVSSGSGIVANGAVTSVAIACGPGIGDGIACGASVCTATAQVCCHADTGAGGTCQAAGPACAAGTSTMDCDDELECGGPPAVCCETIDVSTNLFKRGKCEAAIANCMPAGQSARTPMCKPSSPVCPAGKSCVATGRGYSHCQ
jgi:hypothetical protein